MGHGSENATLPRCGMMSKVQFDSQIFFYNLTRIYGIGKIRFGMADKLTLSDNSTYQNVF